MTTFSSAFFFFHFCWLFSVIGTHEKRSCKVTQYIYYQLFKFSSYKQRDIWTFKPREKWIAKMASYFFLIYLMFKNSISSSSSFLRPGPALSGHQCYIFRRSLQLANRFLRSRASGRQRAMRDLDSRVRRLVRCSEKRGAAVKNKLELDSDLVNSIQIWWLD